MRACVRFKAKFKNRFLKTEKIKGTNKKKVRIKTKKIRAIRRLRRAILEEEYYQVKQKYGEKIEKIARFLAKYIQPVDPLATAEAVAIHLGIVKKKKIRKIAKERLEKLKAFLNKPLPLLVMNALNNGLDKEEALEILAELKGVKKKSLKTASYPSYIKYYSWANLHDEGVIKLHSQNCTKIHKLLREFKDSVELVKYYSTYGEYVKACRKLGVKPLSYERFLRRRWIISIPKNVIRKALEEIAARRKIGEDFRELPPLSA